MAGPLVASCIMHHVRRYTKMLAVSGEVLLMANSTLMTSQLINISRAKRKTDSISVNVPAHLDPATIAAVKSAMLAHAEANKQDYMESSVYVKISSLNNVTLDGHVMGSLSAGWTYAFQPSDALRYTKAKNSMTTVSDACTALRNRASTGILPGIAGAHLSAVLRSEV